MAAGLATLDVLADDGVYAELGEKSTRVADGFKTAAAEAGVPLQTTVFGGMFGFYFSGKPVKNYEDALASNTDIYPGFFKGMLTRGVYLAPSPFEAAFTSTAHTDAELDQTVSAFAEVIRQVKAG